jgi:hypothetical protein
MSLLLTVEGKVNLQFNVDSEPCRQNCPHSQNFDLVSHGGKGKKYRQSSLDLKPENQCHSPRPLDQNLKGRDHLEDLGIDGLIILEEILVKEGEEVWIGFISFRRGTNGRFL